MEKKDTIATQLSKYIVTLQIEIFNNQSFFRKILIINNQLINT